MDENATERIYRRYDFWIQREEFYINLDIAHKHCEKIDTLRREFTKLCESSILAIQASSRLEADVNEFTQRHVFLPK